MELTAEYLRELMHYDPETGVFTRLKKLNRWGWSPAGDEEVGVLNKGGYLQTTIRGYKGYIHRLAWLYMMGDWPKNHIDHIDGDRRNNRWANLRDVTPQANRHNSLTPTKSSCLIGAHRNGKSEKYRSEIVCGGVRKHLGYFTTAQEAHEAYINAKRELHTGWVEKNSPANG